MTAFLIDTNVLSELMRTQPESTVMTWFDRHVDTVCFTSSITKAEIFLGIALLPESIRRTRLENAAQKMFSEDFTERCLPFDKHAAIVYAELVAHRKRIGKPLCTEDAQIAAIAVTENLTLVTRNIKDFTEIEGLKLINPWETA